MEIRQLVLEVILLFAFGVFSCIEGQTVGDVEVVYSWVTVDFTWESEEDREEAIASGAYIPENCIVSGMKVVLLFPKQIITTGILLCEKVVILLLQRS